MNASATLNQTILDTTITDTFMSINTTRMMNDTTIATIRVTSIVLNSTGPTTVTVNGPITTGISPMLIEKTNTASMSFTLTSSASTAITNFTISNKATGYKSIISPTKYSRSILTAPSSLNSLILGLSSTISENPSLTFLQLNSFSSKSFGTASSDMNINSYPESSSKFLKGVSSTKLYATNTNTAIQDVPILFTQTLIVVVLFSGIFMLILAAVILLQFLSHHYYVKTNSVHPENPKK